MKVTKFPDSITYTGRSPVIGLGWASCRSHPITAGTGSGFRSLRSVAAVERSEVVLGAVAPARVRRWPPAEHDQLSMETLQRIYPYRRMAPARETNDSRAVGFLHSTTVFPAGSDTLFC